MNTTDDRCPWVTRWQRKQDPPRPYRLYAARYTPGQPLDGVREVARMATAFRPDPEVTEARFADGPVLLVRYMHSFDDHPPRREYVVVHPGKHLTWADAYDSLDEDDDNGLRQFYDPEPPS